MSRKILTLILTLIIFLSIIAVASGQPTPPTTTSILKPTATPTIYYTYLPEMRNDTTD